MSLPDLVLDYESALTAALLGALAVVFFGRLLQSPFSVLLDKASDSLALTTWLLSRTRLRVYNSSMVLSKTRDRYYTRQRFGIAFAIDIIRSFFTRFMMGASELFSTILLRALSQTFEGSWADVSILGDENDEAERIIGGPESALNATVYGIISKVARIPVATQEDILEDLTASGVIDLPPAAKSSRRESEMGKLT